MTTDLSVKEKTRRPLRASAPLLVAASNLGLLSDLPGSWVGGGFNLISLPDRADNKTFRLKLNATVETLTFTPIGGPIPNRGSVQGDIMLHGLHYLQQVSDAVTFEGLHLEPGLWLNVPPTSDPDVPHDTIVRQSTIPHGDSLLALSTFLATVAGGPTIAPVSSTPTRVDHKPLPFGYFNDSSTPTPLPPGIPEGAIENPNIVLTSKLDSQAKQGMEISKTVVIEVSTHPVGKIVNIPFIDKNAEATRLDAIFWIETVVQPDGTEFMQLQYTQTVNLRFDEIDWPHISVATLVKQ